MNDEIITINHGSGGRITRDFISGLVLRIFDNDVLGRLEDASPVDPVRDGRPFMTTDSHVVRPLFFPGGDIGRLSVCGTVNDLATAGAEPAALSAGLIIEEGFAVKDLERILVSMKTAADEAGVSIITGDTKVVERGKCDGLYINTAGIGYVHGETELSPSRIRPGDLVLVSGPVGNHEACIICARENFFSDARVESDCAPLFGLMKSVLDAVPETRCARDPTRGGVVSTLTEILEGTGFGIEIDEDRVPVDEPVGAVCEVLGMDPLFMANEGKMLVIVPESGAEEAVSAMKRTRYGREAAVIGRVHDTGSRLTLRTRYGTSRILTMPAGGQLPRIC